MTGLIAAFHYFHDSFHFFLTTVFARQPNELYELYELTETKNPKNEDLTPDVYRPLTADCRLCFQLNELNQGYGFEREG